MASNKVDITGVNPQNFLAYLDNANIDESQVIAVDLKNKEMACRAYPPQIPWIKTTKTDLANLLTIKGKVDEGIVYIKIPLYRLKKLKDALKLFIDAKCEAINGTIGVTNGDDGTSLFGTFFEFAAKSLRIRVSATDAYVVKMISDKVWNDFITYKDYFVKCDIKKDFVDRLKTLCTIEADDDGEKAKSFVMSITKDSMSIMSKDANKWKVTYDSERDGNIAINNVENEIKLFVQADILKVASAPMYEAIIFYNEAKKQYMLILTENKDNMIVCGMTEFDEGLV